MVELNPTSFPELFKPSRDVRNLQKSKLLGVKILEQLEDMANNKLNISRLQKDVDRLLDELEKLKDKVRANGTSH